MILTTWSSEGHGDTCPPLLGHMYIDVSTLVFVSTSADLIELIARMSNNIINHWDRD